MSAPQYSTRLLRGARLAVIGAGCCLGLPAIFLRSTWRRRRLLILGYHGLSLADEHEWRPPLYMRPGLFRSRLQSLQAMGCAVLPLAEAIRRLYEGSLPPRAVALTFDDGAHDFYRVAMPLLREFGFPATVYVTSYYSGFNRPVFDVMLSYLLWKARGTTLDWPQILGAPIELDGSSLAAAEAAFRNHARTGGLSGAAKDSLLCELAGRVGQNYADLCARRILHLMTASELAEAASAGFDIQLHTHRHRVSRMPEHFVREIEENRAYIQRVAGANPVHFCYPAGVSAPEFGPVLRSAGVESAVTCRIGLASAESDPLFLPRVLDLSSLTRFEFEAWVSGLAAFVPKRSDSRSPDEIFAEGRDQLLEYDLANRAEARAAAAETTQGLT